MGGGEDGEMAPVSDAFARARAQARAGRVRARGGWVREGLEGLRGEGAAQRERLCGTRAALEGLLGGGLDVSRRVEGVLRWFQNIWESGVL